MAFGVSGVTTTLLLSSYPPTPVPPPVLLPLHYACHAPAAYPGPQPLIPPDPPPHATREEIRVVDDESSEVSKAINNDYWVAHKY